MFFTPAAISKDYEKSQALTALAFLSTLAGRLVSASILLNFNYITMHQWCALFIRALYSEFALEAEAPNPETIEELTKDNHKIKAIFGLFVCELKKEKENATIGVASILRRVEKVMRPFIEGDIEIEVVKEVLTNRSGLNFGAVRRHKHRRKHKDSLEA